MNEFAYLEYKLISVAPYMGDNHLYGFLDKVDNCCNWLQSNLDLPIKGRIINYKKIIKDYDRIRGTYSERFFIFLHAVSEVSRIIDVCETLMELQDSSKNFKETFHKAINGKPYLFECEDLGKEKSRNFLFELLVASKYKKLGFNVDISQTTDVLIHEDFIAIECKRISSRDQIPKRLSEASDQIEMYKVTNPKYCGIVHVNISSCVEENFNVSVSDATQDIHRFKRPPESKQIIDQLIKRLSSETEDLVKEISLLAKKELSENIAYLILDYNFVGADLSLINERVIVGDCRFVIDGKCKKSSMLNYIKNNQGKRYRFFSE